MFPITTPMRRAAICMFSVALACATSANFAQAGDPVIRLGNFPGIWAGHKVQFSIEQVHENGTFDGVAEHIEGRFKGIRFGLHGKIGPENALTVTRYVAGDSQIARVGPPRTINGQWHWSGATTGLGIPEGVVFPFVLVVPEKE